MAFPSAAIGASQTGGTAVTSTNMGVGSPTAGVLLLVIFRWAGPPGTVTFNGFTLLASDSSDASDDQTDIYWRIADGSEGAVVPISWTTAQLYAAHSWKVTGAQGSPSVSSVAVGTTTVNTINSASVSGSFGLQDYLFFSLCGADVSLVGSTSPSSYSTAQMANNSTGSVSVGGAWRQLTSYSDDPGVWTHPAATTGWTAWTVAIAPNPISLVYLRSAPSAAVASATNVATPTSLVPTLSTHQTNDLLLCFTACRSATPTVATPSGWTQLLNLTGTNGRLALFGKIAASSSETNPTVTWSGLTTGTGGTPCQAQCAVFGGSYPAIATIVDVTGTVEDGSASTTAAASGTAATTSADNDLVVSTSTRLDDAGAWTAPSSWTLISGTGTTSGLDMAIGWAYLLKTPAGSVAPADFSLSGASSFASSGVLVGLKTATSAAVAAKRFRYPNQVAVMRPALR